PRSFLVRR
nr:Chain C, PRO-ARG-SER-PHE-LEU-VAL-ARG-ARG [Homo sapiens]